MRDYIPRNEANRVEWLHQFSLWLSANGAGQGFTNAEIAEFAAIVADAGTAALDNRRAQAAALAATSAKNKLLDAAVRRARINAQRLQHSPTMTDSDRGAAGLTIPDTILTPTSLELIDTILPPMLLLDFSIRHQVIIHWGPNPGNEHENARPHGTMGCEIQYIRGGIPADGSGWTTLELDTESPLIHHIHDTIPTTYAYRARYVGKKLKPGPVGAPATCTVSV